MAIRKDHGGQRSMHETWTNLAGGDGLGEYSGFRAAVPWHGKEPATDGVWLRHGRASRARTHGLRADVVVTDDPRLDVAPDPIADDDVRVDEGERGIDLDQAAARLAGRFRVRRRGEG